MNYVFTEVQSVGELAAAIRHAKGFLFWKDSEELAIALEQVAKEIRQRLAHSESFDDSFSSLKESCQSPLD
ncbi:MAG: hypothetical protein ACRCZS_19315 [Chroococcidiopsis sp.]